MSLIVSSVVGGVNEQNSIVNKFPWTAERAIIASTSALFKSIHKV